MRLRQGIARICTQNVFTTFQVRCGTRLRPVNGLRGVVPGTFTSYCPRWAKRGQRAFKITGLTWIVERSLAWLGRNRRLSKDYEYRVQTSEALIDIASIRFMLGRLAPV